jgi:hypothetical protein
LHYPKGPCYVKNVPESLKRQPEIQRFRVVEVIKLQYAG